MSVAFSDFQQLLKQKRYRDAAGLAEKECRNSSPPDPFWLTQQAVALLRVGEPERALSAANQALAADPSNPYAIMVAADSLMGLGKGEDALAYYREALAFGKVAARARKGVLECLSRLSRWQEVLSLLAEWAPPEQESASWKVKALVCPFCNSA